MNLVIKLNNSESLAFFGLFGVFFALQNYYQLLIEKLFPTIIENATSNLGLFKFLYIVALLLITYESYHWIIQLANNMDKTRNLNVDYKFYIAKIVFFGLLGIASAFFLNHWLF
jgi:hypothetical protein